MSNYEPITNVDLIGFLLRLDMSLHKFRSDDLRPPYSPRAIYLLTLHDELKQRLMTAPAFPAARALRAGASGIVGEVPSSGPERSVEPDSPTAVIRRDAQEQPAEGKHPSSVKGIGVEGIDAIIREITEVLVCPGCGNEDEVRATCTICGCTGYDDERIEAIHLRLTALLSPDKA